MAVSALTALALALALGVVARRFFVARPAPGPKPAEPPGAEAPDAPGVRNGHVLVYDAGADRVLLFGGADASQVLSDTWAWDGDARRWRLLGTSGPEPRTFPAVAYDERRHRVTLFGGNRVLFGREGQDGTLLGDTWAFEGGRWTRLAEAGPPPRSEASMAYDARRGRAVLFGGYHRTPSGTARDGDTWEWDGERWVEVAAPGPSARSGASFAYDERRGRAVLFGGSGRPNDTWAWDGAAWAKLASGEPPGRFNAAMTYDARAGALLRFGGWTGERRTDETWTLGDGAWTRLEVPGPPARNHTSLAFDRRRGRAVLFGGHDGENVFGDTWEWDGRAWAQVGFASPRRRIDNGH
jgi:hypothetical protein